MPEKARMKAGRKVPKTGKVQTPKVIRGAKSPPPAAKARPVVMNGISEDDELDDASVGSDVSFFREMLA